MKRPAKVEVPETSVIAEEDICGRRRLRFSLLRGARWTI